MSTSSCLVSSDSYSVSKELFKFPHPFRLLEDSQQFFSTAPTSAALLGITMTPYTYFIP